MRRALLVALAVCLAGGLVFAMQHLMELRAATAPPTPEAFVQAAWSVYRRAPGHQKHVGQHGLACKQCHTRDDGQRFDRPSPEVCRDCHEQESTIQHAQVALDAQGRRSDGGASTHSMTDCLTCHGFGPDPTLAPSDCMRCHARPKHDVPAVQIHADAACTSCHDVHQNRVTPIPCGQCHKVSTSHGAHAAGSPEQCLDCHRAHAPAAIAQESCQGCHQSADSKAPVPASATTAGHTCLGCHTPHQFGKSQVKDCTSCHDSQHVLEGAGHRDCQSCHAPHDVKSSAARETVCTSCHRDVALHHPAGVQASQACISCHVPHPTTKSSKNPLACTSCHQDVSRGERLAHAPGMACTGCHAAHDFTRPLEKHDAVCSACHKARVQQLTGTGHARCEGCHQAVPHGGMGAELACGTCHEQGSKVHRGHQTCTSCHDAHTGSRPAKLCTSCHEQQTKQLSPKHGACQSCHEPHVATPAPQVQSCVGCHQPQKLPALHQVAQHKASCQSCHQAHPEQPPAQAATCRSCHQAMADHQPEATQCSGCHPFAAPPVRRKP